MFIIKVSKKIKFIVSLIACTVAMLCSALPSLAYTYPDDYVAFVKSKFIPSIEKQANISLSDYHYIINSDYSSTHTSNITFTCIIFSKEYDDIVCTSTRPDFGSANGVNVNGVYGYFSTCGTSDFSACDLNDKFFSTTVSHGTNYFTVSSVLYSNCNSITVNNDSIWTDSNAPVTPFTVSYTPLLSKNMSRKGILTAPGASNDGQKIESNGLNVKVTLTDDFINLRNKYDELKDYTYEFICYITTSPPESTSYAESLENAVYTSLSYGKYMYTTSGVVEDVTDDTGEPTNWIKADGINAGNIISKGSTTKNVTINLENLDSSKFTDNTELYIVVYGRLTSMSTPTPDYFDLDNQGYICNKGSLNTKQIITVNADPETGEGIDVTMPDYYCVTSDVFSYKDYPEYKPKIFSNGSEIDTNKPLTDYLDKKLQPDYMYDYDMDKNGEKGLPPDEFAEYEKQKELDKTASSFSFDINGLNDIFAEGGHFFEFLTASISVLPGAFLTILLTFFGVMLAICLVKWLL